MTLQAYQYAGGAGTIAIPNASISSPRSPTTSDTYTPNGNAYQIGQYWSNTTTFLLIQKYHKVIVFGKNKIREQLRL